jgi:hypothetical protein
MNEKKPHEIATRRFAARAVPGGEIRPIICRFFSDSLGSGRNR